MTTIWLTLLLSIAAVDAPAVDGVVFGPGEKSFGERAIVIGEDGGVQAVDPPDAYFGDFVSENLPPSDRSQFYMTMYGDSTDPESRQLVRDLQQHPALKPIAEWCKFTVIDRRISPAGEARHMAAQLANHDVPTLLIYGHPDHPIFGKTGPGGWEYAFERSGYGGDAGLLARDIYRALQKHYIDNGAVGQCPGPYCPKPDQPAPRPQPYQPEPYRPVNPGPATPDDWNTPSLPPAPPAPPDSGNPFSVPTTIPSWAWVAIGAVGVILLLVIGRSALAKIAVILLCLVPLAVGCQKMQPCCYAEEIDTPTESTEPVEQAYLRPPLPPDWEWLDQSVRDEVRRAIDAPRVEGILLDSLANIQVNLAGVVQSQMVAVNKELGFIKLALVAIILGQLATAWLIHVRTQNLGP